jgi:hypothetical protein
LKQVWSAPVIERFFRLRAHDRFQIEIKFDYPLDRALQREQFVADLFLCVPPGLDVNPATYTKVDFYRDLQTYTRYATPKPTVAGLLDATNELSPLTRLARMLEAWSGSAPGPDEQRRAVYELRLLACMLRVHFRDQAARAGGELRAANDAPAFEAAARETNVLLDDAARLVGRLRLLPGSACRKPLPEAVAAAWARVDESVSLNLEGHCGSLYRDLQAAAGEASGEQAPAAAAATRRLASRMRAEEEHRRKAGYPSCLSPDAGPAGERAREDYVRRMAALKRYVQSVLFLSLQAHPGSRPLLYFFYALAAMAAMALFVFLLWLIQDVAPVNSLPYLLALLLGYAFKDRVKDGLKQVFSEHMAGVLNDREGALLDRGTVRAVVGRTAEAFSFVPYDRVPAAAPALHARDELLHPAEEGAPQVALRYQKSVRLFNRRVFRIHRRVDSVNEIWRLSLRRFLYRMDEPRRTLLVPPPDAPGSPAPPVAAEGRRVYELGLALGVRATHRRGAGQPQWESFRLVLTRDGIERIEPQGGA